MVRSQEALLTIGKLAATGDVGVEAVRFYQRKGLLQVPAREGGFRHYGAEEVRRLRFIKQAQSAGFTLDEIKELLGLDAGTNRDRARELAKARIEILDARIADLRKARNALERLAHECSQSDIGPCPILASFDL